MAQAARQSKNFRDLTNAQQRVLGLIAINEDLGHNERVYRALEAKGLIVGEDENRGGFPPLTVRRYHVPMPVHMEWCTWCSENFSETDVV